MGITQSPFERGRFARVGRLHSNLLNEVLDLFGGPHERQFAELRERHLRVSSRGPLSDASCHMLRVGERTQTNIRKVSRSLRVIAEYLPACAKGFQKDSRETFPSCSVDKRVRLRHEGLGSGVSDVRHKVIKSAGRDGSHCLVTQWPVARDAEVKVTAKPLEC